jgi:hypothetical protein
MRQPTLCCERVMLVCWLFFSFAMSFDIGCCSLSKEMSFVVHYLPCFRQQLIFIPCRPFCLSSLCLLKDHEEISSLLPPFSRALRAPHLLCCMFFFSSLFIIQFFFFPWGQSVQGAMLVCPRGSCGNTVCHLFSHLSLLVCISHAGLEWVCGWVGTLLFSQCNEAWRSFVWAWGSGCWSFDSSWWFFSVKCGSSVSAKFLIYRVHDVCFCPLVTILDPDFSLGSLPYPFIILEFGV